MNTDEERMATDEETMNAGSLSEAIRGHPCSSVFAFLPGWVAIALTVAGTALAHNAIDQPSLGRLILEQEIVARGTIVGESRMDGGMLVGRLRADRVLKGTLPAQEVDFASDPDHGIRYQSGERVLLFLTRADRKQPPFTSPQVFSMKYPITSFDPSGYDALVAGMLEAGRVADDTARFRELKDVMLAALRSHERDVRLYAAEQLPVLARRDRVWDEADWRRLEALAKAASLDAEVQRSVRRLLDGRNADVVRHADTRSEGSPR
jgi:hypothetical protein